jgi:PhzF family phenazine biosynthesis protein
MRTLPFQQVDVFTSVPFKGNPVAVVLQGDALSTEEMHAIARWTNLSETTFLCSPTDSGADYRLRIFTPKSELPFAGHPTIGSAHAALRHGVKPKTTGRLVQECGKGLIQIAIDGERLFLALPVAKLSEPDAAQLLRLVDAFGLEVADIRCAAIIDVGPVWVTVQLASAEAVLGLRPDMDKVLALTPVGITGVTMFGLYGPGTATDIEVRSFAPAEGVPEDPVCGSGNGCVAALVRREALVDDRPYLASQGRCLGRDGQVAVRFDEDGVIWVGGHSITCVDGFLTA